MIASKDTSSKQRDVASSCPEYIFRTGTCYASSSLKEETRKSNGNNTIFEKETSTSFQTKTS